MYLGSPRTNPTSIGGFVVTSGARLEVPEDQPQRLAEAAHGGREVYCTSSLTGALPESSPGYIPGLKDLPISVFFGPFLKELRVQAPREEH